MHGFFAKLDKALVTIVPLLYLGGLMFGTATYFTGLTLDFGIPVGFGLAFAIEMHAFLQQRRVRIAYAAWTRAKTEDDKELLAKRLRVDVGALFLCMAFQAYNSTAFWALVLHPHTQSDWAQVALRGVILPFLFLLTGLLEKVSLDAIDILEDAVGTMLLDSQKATVQQWKSRLKAAKKQGINLTHVLVTLLEDAGDAESAKRIKTIDAGLTRTDGVRAQTPRPNDGNLYSSSGQKYSGATAVGSDYQVSTRRLAALPTGRLPRRVVKKTPQERVFDYLNRHPDASLSDLEIKAQVTRETAVKYRQQWLSERSERAE